MDSDQELEIGPQQALPVADFDNFDPSKPPVTGEEYLRRVQLEANNCPAIVVADIETSKYDDNRSSIADSTESAQVTSIFPIQIQQTLTDDFKSLHRRVEHLRCKLESAGKLNHRVHRVSDENHWKSLCLDAHFDRVEDGCDTDEGSKSEKQVKNGSPSVSTLLALSQEDLLQLLEYQSNWIPQYGFSHDNALWIYSILSCLQIPLNGDAYSLLRNVARAIVKQIHSKATAGESSISAHLIICVIARCFNQWDLIQSWKSFYPINTLPHHVHLEWRLPV